MQGRDAVKGQLGMQSGNTTEAVSRNVRRANGVFGLILVSLALTIGLLTGNGPVMAANATMTLDPTPLTLVPGGTGSVDVMVGDFTSLGGLGAYTVAITYSPSVVEVVSVDEGDLPFGGGVPDQGNEGAGGPIAIIDNTSGAVRFTAFQASELPGPTGNIRIARVNLRALGGSGTTSDLSFVTAELIDAQSGESVPVTTTDGSVAIDGVSIGVTVRGETDLEFRSVTGGRVLVEISCPTLTISIVPPDDGTWQFPGVPAETCTLTASAPGYLTAQGQITVGGVDVDVPPNQLLGADANGDGFVTINDITGMVARFGQPTVDCQIDGLVVDVNCDGFVTINDITAGVANFGKGGVQPF